MARPGAAKRGPAEKPLLDFPTKPYSPSDRVREVLLDSGDDHGTQP